MVNCFQAQHIFGRTHVLNCTIDDITCFPPNPAPCDTVDQLVDATNQKRIPGPFATLAHALLANNNEFCTETHEKTRAPTHNGK